MRLLSALGGILMGSTWAAQGAPREVLTEARVREVYGVEVGAFPGLESLRA